LEAKYISSRDVERVKNNFRTRSAVRRKGGNFNVSAMTRDDKFYRGENMVFNSNKASNPCDSRKVKFLNICVHTSSITD
jgi:hypothetical protein